MHRVCLPPPPELFPIRCDAAATFPDLATILAISVICRTTESEDLDYLQAVLVKDGDVKDRDSLLGFLLLVPNLDMAEELRGQRRMDSDLAVREWHEEVSMPISPTDQSLSATGGHVKGRRVQHVTLQIGTERLWKLDGHERLAAAEEHSLDVLPSRSIVHMRALLDDGSPLVDATTGLDLSDGPRLCPRRVDIADSPTSVRPRLAPPRLAGDDELKGVALSLQSDAKLSALAGSQDHGLEEQEVTDLHRPTLGVLLQRRPRQLQRYSPWQDGFSALEAVLIQNPVAVAELGAVDFLIIRIDETSS